MEHDFYSKVIPTEFAPRSFLDYVPSRYGSSDCITAATNCLLAQAKVALSPQLEEECHDITLRLYAKALSTLQTAISDEGHCLDTDVLCAIQLLSLHEVTNSSLSLRSLLTWPSYSMRHATRHGHTTSMVA